MGKIVLIEGTDCSGKETQSNLLMGRLIKEGKRVEKMSFPDYESATGKIIGGPYLGKDYICSSWFKEGAINVDAKVASLYYAADRLYNLDKLMKLKSENDILILDRYTFSNMAHQASKLSDYSDRLKMYKWIEELEFEFLSLPRPDMIIFLHMPESVSRKLKMNRKESLDEHEKSNDYLKRSEQAYIELAKLYGFKEILCSIGEDARSVSSISDDVYSLVKKIL